MNSNGPKIDPWGTPVVIDKVREFVPCTISRDHSHTHSTQSHAWSLHHILWPQPHTQHTAPWLESAPYPVTTATHTALQSPVSIKSYSVLPIYMVRHIVRYVTKLDILQLHVEPHFFVHLFHKLLGPLALHRDSQYNDKTVMRLSYLHKGNPYTALNQSQTKLGML